MKKGKKKPRRRLPGEGAYFEFHGSFADETRADRRARARGGFYVKRSIPGIGRRFVVMVQRTAPF